MTTPVPRPAGPPRRLSFNGLSWLVILLGAFYFLVPLFATLEFSLRAQRGVLSLRAYELVFRDPSFYRSFLLSVELAAVTILNSLLVIVPTAYWVHLRLPRWRPVVEFVTLLPFVVPAVVLVFGLIRTYSRPPLILTTTSLASNFLLVCAYTILSFPYMYRAVDAGLRAMDVRTLTEAAQSLGASWPTILLRVIFPNLRVALLSGAFLTFAIVIGEFTIAVFLARPTFGPYLSLLIQNKAYEPAAVSIISFTLTWLCMLVIQWLGRRTPGQAQIGGPR
jgi:putative spermidine/putrescine transport system permease protein